MRGLMETRSQSEKADFRLATELFQSPDKSVIVLRNFFTDMFSTYENSKEKKTSAGMKLISEISALLKDDGIKNDRNRLMLLTLAAASLSEKDKALGGALVTAMNQNGLLVNKEQAKQEGEFENKMDVQKPHEVVAALTEFFNESMTKIIADDLEARGSMSGVYQRTNKLLESRSQNIFSNLVVALDKMLAENKLNDAKSLLKQFKIQDVTEFANFIDKGNINTIVKTNSTAKLMCEALNIKDVTPKSVHMLGEHPNYIEGRKAAEGARAQAREERETRRRDIH